MRHLLVIIDRTAFEERLASYLSSRSVREQTRFLRQHGIAVSKGLDRSQLHQMVTELLCSLSDLALGAQSQQLLIREASDA